MVLIINDTQFFLKLEKLLKIREINENKMLKRQIFQKNELYNTAFFNFFENS